MPSEVNAFYAEGKTRYLADMDGVIGKIADIVGTGLNAARARIAQGKAEIAKYVAQLPQDLKKVGQEAESKLESQFEQLESDIESKQREMVDTLARKYVESRDALDARIDEMKAANQGLVDKAMDAIVGVIKTIIQLKNMLLGVLAKAAGVIGDILADPIGFLSNLIGGIKAGLSQFVGNIVGHLQQGLMGWLTGALGNAGIELPKTFDIKGIFSLVLQVLGLTYASIRARVVKQVGEPVVQKLEQTVDIFKVLITEGLGGLWRFVQDRIGDLEETVIGGIKDFIIEKVIKAGITWLIAFMNPAAAFIKACKAIYDIIMFLIERGSEIMAFVNSVLDSIAAVAKGNIGAMAAEDRGQPGQGAAADDLLPGQPARPRRHLGQDPLADPEGPGADQQGDRLRHPGRGQGRQEALRQAREVGQGQVRQGQGLGAGQGPGKAAQVGLPEDPNARLAMGRAAALAAVRRFAGQRVGAQLLRPLLTGIKVRYGFTSLDVLPQGGEWRVAGKINPEFDDASGVLTPEDMKSDKEDGKTLEVGGGNFSFAVSIAAKTKLGDRFVATNYEVAERGKLKKTAKEQERDKATQDNMAALEAMGVEVVPQVDATDPNAYPEGEFDVIVFNHPYVGAGTRGSEAGNVALLGKFLETAKGKIREGGKIMIISSKFRLRRWKLDELAAKLDLDQVVKKFEHGAVRGLPAREDAQRRRGRDRRARRGVRDHLHREGEQDERMSAADELIALLQAFGKTTFEEPGEDFSEEVEALVDAYPAVAGYEDWLALLRVSGGVYAENDDVDLGLYGFGEKITAFSEGDFLDQDRYFGFGEMMYLRPESDPILLAFDTQSGRCSSPTRSSSGYSPFADSFRDLLARLALGDYPPRVRT